MTGSADLRAALGPTGIWAALDGIPVEEVLDFAAAVEALGFPALWINEGSGREPFALLGALSRTTSRITLGLGVATIYARDAAAARAGGRTVNELSGGRFVMGIGVSHRSSAVARGHEYAAPLSAMRDYLDAWDAAPWTGPATAEPPLILAALGPRMLTLAATRSAGAFPYLVTTEHVRRARETLDASPTSNAPADRPVLVVSLPAILGEGPEVRAAARTTVARYLGQPNYRANLVRVGITETDMDDVPDSLVDALVAIGDARALGRRVAEMHAAGADHVTVIPLSPGGRQASLDTARAVAP